MAVYFDVLADAGSWAFALSLGNHSITVSEAGASGRTGRVTAKAALAPIAPAMPLKCAFNPAEGSADTNVRASVPNGVFPFHSTGDSDA